MEGGGRGREFATGGEGEGGGGSGERREKTDRADFIDKNLTFTGGGRRGGPSCAGGGSVVAQWGAKSS